VKKARFKFSSRSGSKNKGVLKALPGGRKGIDK